LLILWKERKQLCSLPEKAFDDIPAALAFMKVIGEKFAADLLSTKREFRELRTEMGDALGICLKQTGRPLNAAVTASCEAASGSATAAVTGLSEAASGSASAAVTGSSEIASGSSKGKRIIASASTKRKVVITNRPVVDKKVVERKLVAAKVCNTPARASLEGKHEGDMMDVDDDEDFEFDFEKFPRKWTPVERFSCPGVFPPDFCH
jgi:hypothetical protein